MIQRYFSKLVLGVIATAIVGAVAIAGLAIFCTVNKGDTGNNIDKENVRSKTGAAGAAVPGQAQANNATQSELVIATAVASPTQLPTVAPTSTIVATATPNLPANIQVLNPAVAVGELISHPALDNAPNLKLRHTDQTPKLSVQKAMQAVADTGVLAALGGQYQGKDVLTTGFYGLATIGGPTDTSKVKLPDSSVPQGGCKDWAGMCNIGNY